MHEYIEREAAIKLFTFATLDCLGMEPMIRSADVVAALKSIPASDVAPVRHGRWIELENGDCKCSICGCYHHTWEAHGYYCQHCGARMDLVTDCNQVKDGDGE